MLRRDEDMWCYKVHLSWNGRNGLTWYMPMQPGYIDDRLGPLGLAGVVVLALTAIFIISITDFILQLRVPTTP